MAKKTKTPAKEANKATSPAKTQKVAREKSTTTPPSTGKPPAEPASQKQHEIAEAKLLFPIMIAALERIPHGSAMFIDQQIKVGFATYNSEIDNIIGIQRASEQGATHLQNALKEWIENQLLAWPEAEYAQVRYGAPQIAKQAAVSYGHMFYLMMLIDGRQPTLFQEWLNICCVPLTAKRVPYKELPRAFMQNGTLHIKGVTFVAPPDAEHWYEPVVDPFANEFLIAVEKFTNNIRHNLSAVDTFCSFTRAHKIS